MAYLLYTASVLQEPPAYLRCDVIKSGGKETRPHVSLSADEDTGTAIGLQWGSLLRSWAAVTITPYRGKRKQVFLELGKALIERNKKETQGKGTPGPDLGWCNKSSLYVSANAADES